MKKLLATSDVSLIQSLRMALDSEGIQFAVGNETMAPLQPITVHVADDDFEAAHALMLELQDTPSGVVSQPGGAKSRSWVVVILALLALGALCIQLF